MTYTPIQTAFSGGEISPRLRGRVDADIYKKALGRAENWMITPQGSALLRPGTTLVATAPTTAGKILPLPVPRGPGYILELSDRQARILSGGVAQDFHGTELLPELKAGFWGGSGAEFADGVATLRGRDYTQGFPGVDSVGFRLWLAAGSYTLRVATKEANCNPRVYVEGLLDTVQSAGWEYSEDYYTLNVLTPGDYSVSVMYQVSAESLEINPNRTFESFKLVEFSLKPQAGMSALGTPWTAAQVEEVVAVQRPGKATSLVYRPGTDEVFEVGRDAEEGVFIFRPVSFVLGEFDRIEKVDAITFFQGRTWAASENRLVATNSGTFLDFTVSEPTVDSDRLDVLLPLASAVRWLRGQRDTLLIGTATEEFRFSSSGGVIVARDMEGRTTDSEFGAAPVSPITIGSQVAYVGADRRALWVPTYSREADLWDSDDIAFIAEHITEPGVVEAHFVRGSSLVALLLADGTMACCTYSRLRQIAAWWRFTTAGTIRSAAVLDSDFWLLVARGPSVFLERFGAEIPLDAQVPAETRSRNTEKVWTIDGFAALEGRTVTVVSEGVVYPGRTVSGDTIALDAEPEPLEACAGLPYPSTKLETLPPADAPAARKRWVSVMLRLNDSALPTVNGQRPADRKPATPMDTAEPRTTGDVEVKTLGWAENGILTIEQNLPLRTEILAIFGAVQANRT